MRLVVARCAVSYEGRLGARLAPAPRLIVCKARRFHRGALRRRAYKPLNWMSPPCTIHVSDDEIVARNAKGRRFGSSCSRCCTT